MAKFIGVMSGTSLDGIDIALCEIDDSSCSLLAAAESPFDPKIKEEILSIIHGSTTLKQVGGLNIKLGQLYADAINTFLKKHKYIHEKIEAVGLHGQTVWHEPNSKYPFSMQLGSASVVAAQTNLPVVNDFRSNDVANGGEGAPFAPLFHKFEFERIGKNSAVVNIGGMANITLLGDRFLGWDSGCGNVLLDYWTLKTQNRSYDKDGEFARSGKLNQALLDAMLSDPYFAKQAPKSTGREYFNSVWLEVHLRNFSDLSDADVQATLTELTAYTITNGLQNVREIILCGGGAKNSYLKERIAALSNVDVTTTNQYGVDSDFLEAMIFAWLAYKRLNDQSVDLSQITGAAKNSILGAVYLP